MAQDDEVVYYEPVEFVGKYKPRWWSVVIDSSLMGYRNEENGTAHVILQGFYTSEGRRYPRLIVEHEGYLYTAFLSTVGKYPSGYLLEKRDLETGGVVWQAKYDSRWDKYIELPKKIFIRDGALHLVCMRGLDTTNLNMGTVSVDGKPAVWSLRSYDLETGALLAHRYTEAPTYSLVTNLWHYGLYSIFYSRRESRYIYVQRGADIMRNVAYSRGDYYSICRLDSTMNIDYCDTVYLPFLDTFGFNIIHDIRETESGYIGVEVKYFYWSVEDNEVQAIMWLLDESFELKRQIDISKQIIMMAAFYFRYPSTIRSMASCVRTSTFRSIPTEACCQKSFCPLPKTHPRSDMSFIHTPTGAPEF